MRAALLLIALALMGCTASSNDPLPVSKDVRLQLGVAYLTQGKLALAKPHLQAALEDSPHSLNAVIAMAQWHLAANETDSALSLYQQALSWQPMSGALYNNYAVALCMAGKWDDALRYFDKVSLDAQYPYHAKSQQNRAQCEKNKGHYASQP
ncbi:pilus assembly protein PilF [Idiomarina sp. X4]|uniref:tetratricopeptide repeat protein n=1 Tax=unclassified Idiomarina TaxID=2614829 RepID=UPI000C28333E|nr:MULTISPECIES: tetratricopeptide repeat protein [unclassified Idiomarina]ATZ73710.1 pilus assembly protein PilF [Idiomarina sp. X4]RXS42425.1 tetratricopeptide repeat protein [Idiomarina sp. 29L]